VSLEVFDVAGRLVRTLVHRELPAGSHDVFWNASADTGGRVSAGVYLYRLRAGGFTASQRLVVLR
jgi:flagellar hook assembly protein FlgD